MPGKGSGARTGAGSPSYCREVLTTYMHLPPYRVPAARARAGNTRSYACPGPRLGNLSLWKAERLHLEIHGSPSFPGMIRFGDGKMSPYSTAVRGSAAGVAVAPREQLWGHGAHFRTSTGLGTFGTSLALAKPHCQLLTATTAGSGHDWCRSKKGPAMCGRT